MPKLNSQGWIASGVGEGIVALTRPGIDQIIVAQHAGGTCFLWDNVIAWQQVHPGDVCELLTWVVGEYAVDGSPVVHQLAPRGANALVADQGCWAAMLSDGGKTGVYGHFNGTDHLPELGTNLPAAAVLAAGAGGVVAIKPVYQSMGGLALYPPTPGSVALFDAEAPERVTVLSVVQATWVSGVDQRLHGTQTLAQPLVQPPCPIWAPATLFVGHELWTVAWTDVWGLIAWGPDLWGYRATPRFMSAYHHDAKLLADRRTIRVCWSATEGEPPQDVQWRDLYLGNAREDFSRLPDPPVPPDPPVIRIESDVSDRMLIALKEDWDRVIIEPTPPSPPNILPEWLKKLLKWLFGGAETRWDW